MDAGWPVCGWRGGFAEGGGEEGVEGGDGIGDLQVSEERVTDGSGEGVWGEDGG